MCDGQTLAVQGQTLAVQGQTLAVQGQTLAVQGQTLAVQGQTLALQLSADEQTQLKHRQQFALSSLSHHIYRVSQEEWTKLQESAPYVKIYRYNPKHLCP